jgi:hypothetical protein
MGLQVCLVVGNHHSPRGAMVSLGVRSIFYGIINVYTRLIFNFPVFSRFIRGEGVAV